MPKLITIIIMSVSFAAHADSTLIFNDSGRSADAGTQTTMQVKDGMVLMTSGESVDQKILYRESDNALVQMDTSAKTYTVVDAEATKAISGQMDEAVAMMEQQMKNLPPEQREMLMQRMPQLAGRMNKTAPPKYTVEHQNKSSEVAGVTCKSVVMYKDGEVFSKACIANAKQLGISKADYKSIENMMTMMQKMAAQFGQTDVPDFSNIGGFPVMNTEPSSAGGKSSELQSVSTDSIGKEVFEIPGNFKKVEIGQ